MIDLFVSLKRGVPSSRTWTITNADGTARSLAGLTPYLLINQADDATALTTEITGTVSGSDVTFAIPALTTATIGGVPATTIPAGTYPTHLSLRATVGGAQATDGKWSGQTAFDGGGALASVEDLKSFLDIKHSEDDSNVYQSVVAASRWFESQVGRTIAAANYVEIQDGNGGQTIIPGNSPLISVSALTIDGTAVAVSTGYGVQGYFIAGNVVRLRSQYVSSGVGNVSISYRAGYELSAIPSEVRQAVVEVAGLMYRERTRVGQQSANISGESVTFYYAPPARVIATIEAYRWAQ
jgi:hypothetical protein